MKLAAFIYSFPHKKTQEGLLKLFLHGMVPDVAFAADAVPLTFRQSRTRVSMRGLRYEQPSLICERIGTRYINVPHASREVVSTVEDLGIDTGIILGARILPQHIIDAFSVGIVNLHPGMLPDNRGLDNLKWALIKDIPMAVSSHFIDAKIDLGWLYRIRWVPVFWEDTLVDIMARIQSTELEEMIELLNAVRNGLTKDGLPHISGGTKFDAVSDADDANLDSYLETYKSKFAGVTAVV